MDRMIKHLTRSRGAAAAFLFSTIAPVVGAQSTEPVRARSRDSVVVRMFTMPGVPMDSLRVLVRALEREPYGSADWVTITRRVDSLLAHKSALIARQMAEGRIQLRTAPGFAPTGWLGFLTQGPSEQILDDSGQHVIYFAYPTIISVDPNSPAERAGIAPGDVLLAYNGLDVVNRDFNLTRLLRPANKVSITIRRDGESKDFSVIVARGPQRINERRKQLEATMPVMAGGVEPVEAPEGRPRVPMPATAPTPMPPMPRLVDSWSNAMFGASFSAVKADLAEALNLKLGVLATDVPEETPAWRAGLRSGDVIVSVEDEPVFSVNEFRERVMTHLPRHSVALQVVRNQKPRTIRLSWPSP